ncbi:hypothetical protein GAY28_24230, partial [Azospirillum brasilense]|nr:hypothetical protein [Azospirillum brasilense]
MVTLSNDPSAEPSAPRALRRRNLGRLVGRRPALAVGVLLFAVLPLVANPYQVYVGNLALIYVILAVGLNILLGLAGQLSFANGALFGVGAYATGLLRLDAGLPFWLALPAGTAITVAIGLAIALPALRLCGPYLALSTLASAQLPRGPSRHRDPGTHAPPAFALTPSASPHSG